LMDESQGLWDGYATQRQSLPVMKPFEVIIQHCEGFAHHRYICLPFSLGQWQFRNIGQSFCRGSSRHFEVPRSCFQDLPSPATRQLSRIHAVRGNFWVFIKISVTTERSNLSPAELAKSFAFAMIVTTPDVRRRLCKAVQYFKCLKTHMKKVDEQMHNLALSNANGEHPLKDVTTNLACGTRTGIAPTDEIPGETIT
jgi:hypothetical protein